VSFNDARGKVVIEHAWLALERIVVLEGPNCAAPFRNELSGGVVDLMAGSLPQTLTLNHGVVCGVELLARHAVEGDQGAPAELIGQSLVVRGRRSDATPLKIALKTLSTLVYQPATPIQVNQNETNLFATLDVAKWFIGANIDDLTPNADGEIVISEQSLQTAAARISENVTSSLELSSRELQTAPAVDSLASTVQLSLLEAPSTMTLTAFQPYTYSFRARNIGQQTIENFDATLYTRAPEGTTWRVEIDSRPCNASNGGFTCHLTTLATAAESTITAQLVAPSDGNVDISIASVSGGQGFAFDGVYPEPVRQPVAIQWTQETSLSAPQVETPTVGAAAALYKDHLYIVGGFSYRSELPIYTTIHYARVDAYGNLSNWKHTQMARGTTNHSVLVVGDQLLQLGGNFAEGAGSPVVAMRILPEGGIEAPSEQRVVSQLPYASTDLTSVLVNDRIYIVGNAYPLSASLTEVLDSDTEDGWRSERNAQFISRSSLATVTYANRIYAIGGSLPWEDDGTAEVVFSEIQADGSLNAWQSTTPLPLPLRGHTALVVDNKIVVMGGRSGPNQINTLQDKVYTATIDAATGQLSAWQELEGLPRAVAYAAMATRTLGGRTDVYLAGGLDNMLNYKAEVFCLRRRF